MKFKVENLGLLRKAEFEIGDLTMICGENNSGKTYAVYAFYGFWRLFFENLNKFVLSHKNSFSQKDKTILIKKTEFIEFYNNLKSGINEYYKNDLAKVLGGNADNYKDTKFELDFQLLNFEKIFNQQNLLFNTYERDRKSVV